MPRMSEIDLGTQYSACRERIVALVVDLTDEQAESAQPYSATLAEMGPLEALSF